MNLGIEIGFWEVLTLKIVAGQALRAQTARGTAQGARLQSVHGAQTARKARRVRGRFLQFFF